MQQWKWPLLGIYYPSQFQERWKWGRKEKEKEIKRKDAKKGSPKLRGVSWNKVQHAAAWQPAHAWSCSCNRQRMHTETNSRKHQPLSLNLPSGLRVWTKYFKTWRKSSERLWTECSAKTCQSFSIPLLLFGQMQRPRENNRSINLPVFRHCYGMEEAQADRIHLQSDRERT